MTRVSLIWGWSDTSLSLAPLQLLVDRLLLQVNRRSDLIEALGSDPVLCNLASPAFHINSARVDLHELKTFVTGFVEYNETLKQ